MGTTSLELPITLLHALWCLVTHHTPRIIALLGRPCYTSQTKRSTNGPILLDVAEADAVLQHALA